MRNLILLVFFLLSGCVKMSDQGNSDKVLNNDLEFKKEHLKKLGFDLNNGFFVLESGFVVENDAFIKFEDVLYLKRSEKGLLFIDKPRRKNTLKKQSKLFIDSKDFSGHYYESILPVSAWNERAISIYLDDSSISGSLSSSTVQTALDRYNYLGLRLSFYLTNDSTLADIIIRGVSSVPYLMAAGFAYYDDPYHEILVNTSYNFDLRADGASIVAHEIGHCIGFRHTDYMDRSFSCGGYPHNEFPEPNYIPGSPIGPSLDSWMLSCANGTDRPFTIDDVNALKTLYHKNSPIYLKVNKIKYSDNSYFTSCCDFTDVVYDVEVEFFEDSSLTIPYISKDNLYLKFFNVTSNNTSEIIYNIPNNVSKFKIPAQELWQSEYQWGDLVSNDSEYLYLAKLGFYNSSDAYIFAPIFH